MQFLFDFLTEGTSAFHVTDHATKILADAGFEKLELSQDWLLEKGKKYYVNTFGSTFFAFTIGKDCDFSKGLHLAVAHTDFPALKIKPNPEITSHGYLQLNTEVYGGPILSTYFDRPLSIAGKVMVRGERYDEPISHLIDFKKPVLCLPNLAIHMNRGVNDGEQINYQNHLIPVIGLINDSLNKECGFTQLLAKELGVDANDILDYDLTIYNIDQPKLAGFNDDFVLSPRLDNITSVSAIVKGLIDSENDDRINMIAAFDNEEIGSQSKQGAKSTLPKIVLSKVWKAFGRDHTQCISDITKGMMLSCDVAHAYHPNYPSKYDITNFPISGKGLMLKTASNQSYTDDCRMIASMVALCQEHHIPYQRFVKRSDQKGGGTIGSMLSAQLSILAADCGVGLWGMHSSCETMGKEDQKALTDFLCAFFTY